MRTAVALLAGPDLTLTEVSCRDHHAGWSAPEAPSAWRVLVLARRGRFRRRGREGVVDVDPHFGYLTAPDREESFSHPAGGDVCTAIGITPQFWDAHLGAAMAGARVYVDARMELLHRRVLAAASVSDPDYALVEQLLGLLAAAAGREEPAQRQSAADRALATAARDALAAAHPTASGLLALATFLQVSPYRLSRAFSKEFGVSITRYRNRVRVGEALRQLAGGASDLAGLAAALGFADQAHLHRTVRQQVGETPGALRAMLNRQRSPPR